MSREPPIVSRALDFDERVALSDERGTYSYDFIHSQSARVAGGLLGDLSDLAGARVAFLVPPELEYVLAQWGVWRAGGIAVPLCMAHPRPELEYVIDDCQPDLLLASRTTLERLKPIARSRKLELHEVSDLPQALAGELPSIAAERPAMIVYTSGTTGGPKGVVTTHANIAAQIRSLVEAWEWVSADRIRLVLPLHHVHGIVNVLGCALWSGARCDMVGSFDAAEVWESFVDTEPTLFMAVPTIYAKLAAVWQQADRGDQERWTRAARNLRLMVSGSAALPEQLFDLWDRITGHRLLERYGMTEIGMALSNPLHGERRPGHVGQPLPGVDVRRVDAEGDPVADDIPGEIEVRGATVFREYWQRPTETAGAFRQG